MPQDDRPPLADSALFRPGRIGALELPNRVVVAPMTRISATPEGHATDEMAAYYADYATGGFGLIVSEGIYPDDAYSQGYVNQPGLASDAQAESWQRVTRAVHGAGGRIFAQLMHAGATSVFNRFRQGTVGPSAVRPRGDMPARYHGKGPFPVPREITGDEIAEAIAGFAAAAARAARAGFDGVEIHGANGYLIDQFLTDYTNLRGDDWGGPLENRLRLANEVARAVVAAVPAGFPVGMRLSQTKSNDLHHSWAGGEADAATIFGTLGRSGLAYLHVSSHVGTGPVFGTGLSLAGLAARHAPVPVIANGKLDDPEAALHMLEDGGASFVSLAKGALADPAWPRRIAEGRAPVPFAPGMIAPFATIATTRAWREAQRD